MIISIDGNIGSGKSSLLSYLTTAFSDSTDVFPEPFHIWGETLQKFFDDPASWSCAFTLDVLAAFHRVKESAKPHQIVERHPRACIDVFAEISKNDGHITKTDLETIREYESVFSWIPDAIVYLDVDPLTCHNRIRQRERRGEDVEYDRLRVIEYRYKKMLESIGTHVIVAKQLDHESAGAFHARIAYLIQNMISS